MASFIRESWTDERLDDLNGRVGELSGRVDHLSGRIGALQHTMLLVGGGVTAAMAAILAGILGLIATQL